MKTAKGTLMHQINLLSSGTIAVFIGNNKYAVIDRAACKTLQLVASMTEEECAGVQTMEDIGNLFLTAQKKIS